MARTYVSPLTRAQQTLRTVATEWPAAGAPTEPDVTTLHDLREVELLEWTGMLKGEVHAAYPVAYEAWRCGMPGTAAAGSPFRCDIRDFKLGQCHVLFYYMPAQWVCEKPRHALL